MTADRHCGACDRLIRYATTAHGAWWVHVETGSAITDEPFFHDCNTYLPRRMAT